MKRVTSPERHTSTIRPNCIAGRSTAKLSKLLATALGHAAVGHRYRVHFERCDNLLRRLEASGLDISHDAAGLYARLASDDTPCLQSRSLAVWLRDRAYWERR